MLILIVLNYRICNSLHHVHRAAAYICWYIDPLQIYMLNDRVLGINCLLTSAFMKCKGTICSNIQIHLTILKIIFQIHTDLLIISSGLNIHEWAYNCKVTHYTWSANAKYMDKNCVIFVNILCKMKSWRNNQW